MRMKMNTNTLLMLMKMEKVQLTWAGILQAELTF